MVFVVCSMVVFASVTEVVCQGSIRWSRLLHQQCRFVGGPELGVRVFLSGKCQQDLFSVYWRASWFFLFFVTSDTCYYL